MKGLVVRDVKLALRSGGGFGLGIAFFLIFCVLAPLGIGSQADLLSQVAPGVVWFGALLACLLSLDRMLALDWEDGSIDVLVTAPLPLEATVLAKAVAHWLTTGLPMLLLAPVLGGLLHLPSAAYGWLALSLLLGTPALSMIGGFGAALTVGQKRGGLLLSLLVLPLYIPTLVFGAELARRGAFEMSVSVPLLMLSGITAGTIALLPFPTAAVLRVSLR